MRKSLLIILSLMFWITISVADETGGKFAFGLKGGLDHYSGDLQNSKWATYGDVHLTYWMVDQFGMNLTYGLGFLGVDRSASNYFKTWNYSLALMLRYKPFPKSSLNPYLTGGFEWFKIHPKDRNGFAKSAFTQGVNDGKFKRTNNAIPIGVGLSYFLNEWLSLDAEGLAHFSFIDYIDAYEAGERKDSWVSVAAGLSVYLGKPKDTDGDGIPDRIDKDPLHAEDFDHFQDEDGAPDYDNDQDGVMDQVDKAPNQPEDRDGYMDEDGVPDPDNDADGIPDVKDKAPNQPEDKDGYMDEDGMPDPDNDQDGILDTQDECPDQPETMNGYEDDDGCPDKKPEIAVEKGKAIVLEGVHFATGSARLTADSKTILDKVVRTLKENPEIVVEIRGYTDNTGSYKANMRLSQKRADAVRDYLISQGIDGARVQAKGYGPANPIADNNTPQGRAKNRRIEFYRIK